MANSIQFSDVQLLNLSFLMAIQASVRKDPIAACYKYGLSADQAPKVAELPPEKIQTLVANLAHACLFTPRHDFLQLLEAPAGLVGPLSTVRAPHPDFALFSPVDRRNGKRSGV